MSVDSQRVCLLTGASGRLGTLFCRLYGHRYRIAAVHHTRSTMQSSQMCWSIDPLDPAARKPIGAPGFATFAADLGDPCQIPAVAEFALDTFGRVDVLVNAAAITHCTRLLDANPNAVDIARVFDVNTVAPLRLAADLANRFWRTRIADNTALNRNIVNVSSTSGSYVFAGQGAYSASKAALNMLTCHMAEEFAAFGMRVNAIAPDSFPQAISTESVCDAIARMDQGSLNGELLLLEST